MTAVETSSNLLLNGVQKELEAHSSAVRMVLTKLAERIIAVEQVTEEKLNLLKKTMELNFAELNDKMTQAHNVAANQSEEIFTSIRQEIQTLFDTTVKRDQYTPNHEVIDSNILHSLEEKQQEVAKAMEREIQVRKQSTISSPVMTRGPRKRSHTMCLCSGKYTQQK
jgi:hypothetical protein